MTTKKLNARILRIVEAVSDRVDELERRLDLDRPANRLSARLPRTRFDQIADIVACGKLDHPSLRDVPPPPVRRAPR